MKKKIKERGYVSRIIEYGESSLILHIFGESLGNISILAKGIRKKKDRSLITVLNEYEFSLYEPSESGLYLYSEASCINEPICQHNPVFQAAGLCALELYHQIIIGVDECPLYYELLRKYIDYQNTIEKNHVSVFWRFFLRVLIVMGVELKLSTCHVCGKQIDDYTGYDRFTCELLCHYCFSELELSNRYQLFQEDTSNVLKQLPKLSEHINSLVISRNCVVEINNYLKSYFSIHFHKQLSLKSLNVLEQYYL